MQPSCVQTKEGKSPAGVVGSELAAMFCLAVLPDLLHGLLARCGCEVGSAQHDELCKAYAASIGLPHLWPHIYYPFPVSLDNDSRHHWVRESLLQPRMSDEQAQILEFELEQAEQKAVVHHLASDKLRGMSARGTPITEGIVRLAHEAALAEAQLASTHSTALAVIEDRLGMSFKTFELRRRMKDCPWLRIVLPHQFMPLTKVAPEVHMTVEHQVDNCKLDLSADLWYLLCTCSDEVKLFSAVTYQDMIYASAAKRSSRHGREVAIAGSIRKQMQCTRALAANPDQCVVLMKVSKHGQHVTVAVMPGTAGDRVPGPWN